MSFHITNDGLFAVVATAPPTPNQTGAFQSNICKEQPAQLKHKQFCLPRQPRHTRPCVNPQQPWCQQQLLCCWHNTAHPSCNDRPNAMHAPTGVLPSVQRQGTRLELRHMHLCEFAQEKSVLFKQQRQLKGPTHMEEQLRVTTVATPITITVPPTATITHLIYQIPGCDNARHKCLDVAVHLTAVHSVAVHCVAAHSCPHSHCTTTTLCLTLGKPPGLLQQPHPQQQQQAVVRRAGTPRCP